MLNINPVNNVVVGKKPAFKANPTQVSQTSYNTVPNELNGSEALAVYNVGMINHQQNLDIPTIRPIPIETDINKIKGDKIYNSKGELVKILDENNDVKKEYFIKNNLLDFYKQTDKSNLEKLIMYYDDNKISFVDRQKPNGVSYSTSYDENGNVEIIQKDFFNKNKDVSISYDSKTEKYYVNYYDHIKNKSTFLEFNKNKQCISAESINGKFDDYEEVNFYNNQPYKITKRSDTIIPNNIKVKGINLNNLEPEMYKEYDLENIKTLDGDKTYYSNGNLEKLVTSDGTEYQIDLDERFFTVKQGNKKINYEKNIFGEWNKPVVDETLNNGAKKQTKYFEDGSTEVFYDENNLHKSASFYPDGSLSSYSEQNNDNIKDINFDEQGNLINVWDNNKFDD